MQHPPTATHQHPTTPEHPPTLATVRAALERLWPGGDAEAWDRVGLVSGRDEQPIHTILLAIDPVRATIDEAISIRADLLLTHHPLLLRGVHSIAEEHYKGALLADLIRANCALLTAHTNADIPAGGVSDALAASIGLDAVAPIVSAGDSSRPEQGIGRVGRFEQPVSLRELAERIARIVPATASGVRVAGDPQRLIHTVALCGGAGDGLLSHPLVTGADVFITADLRHHPASEAVEQARVCGGPALIDLSHWASEWVWLPQAAARLREVLPGIQVIVSERNTDVWTFRPGSDTALRGVD